MAQRALRPLPLRTRGDLEFAWGADGETACQRAWDGSSVCEDIVFGWIEVGGQTSPVGGK